MGHTRRLFLCMGRACYKNIQTCAGCIPDFLRKPTTVILCVRYVLLRIVMTSVLPLVACTPGVKGSTKSLANSIYKLVDHNVEVSRKVVRAEHVIFGVLVFRGNENKQAVEQSTPLCVSFQRPILMLAVPILTPSPSPRMKERCSR